MILKKLKEYLDDNNIKYYGISHSQAFTAEDISKTAHIPIRELAKTVMVKVDGKILMAIVPASDMVSFKKLKKILGAEKVELAEESDFNDIFPMCELGAMPPFGNLYNVDVLVASSLTEDKNIAFNAGSHRELIKMEYRDFEKLIKPKIMDFSIKKRTPEDDHWSYEY